MSVALKRTTVTREQLRAALSRAVESGQLDVEDAYEVMAAYDAGTLDRERIAVLMGDDDQSRLVTFAAATALAIVLSRQRAAPVRWAWDARRLEYVAPGGEALHPAMLRRVVDVTIDRAAAPMRASAPRVVSGDLPLAQWRLRMDEWVAEKHIMAAAAARGGVNRVTEGDRVWIRGRILSEYSHLDNFEADLRRGRLFGTPMTDAQTSARIAMYANASRATFEGMRGRIATDIGFDEELNVLGVSEHCKQCREQTALGYVPLGSLVPVGSRTCLSNCRCSLRFRKRPTPR